MLSDLHLQAPDQETAKAWSVYMDHTPADAVFILGDLFEVWVGDDVLSNGESFEASCVEVFRRNSQRTKIFVMHGNRDFLMGQALMSQCGSTLIADPSVLQFGSERWLLSHGDALCLDDTSYQQFRAEVRSPAWQKQFLSKPLSERMQIARAIRVASEQRKSDEGIYSVVDQQAALAAMLTHGATQLIHGHTHQPADHVMSAKASRHVLSDWDVRAGVPRSEVFRIQVAKDGTSNCQRLSPVTAAIPLD